MLNNENGRLIYLLVIGILGDNLGNSDYKKKVKSEGRPSLWVKPLYGIQPKIIFDRKNHVNQKNLLKCMAFATRVHHLST
jgi:hypothetical protein